MTALLERLNEALAGRYSVESEIGRGGMATVFLAEDIRHHRKVAIKVLHPELASAVGAGRFLNEVETVAGLNHPHILPLHDSGEAEGLLYYVMPFIEGESLRERLETQGQLPVEEAVRIAVEVADGLDYAHGKGIVHRDVKPGNILLSGKHAVIADFGIARAITVARDDRLTGTGLALGTPLYASPEQATGAETLDGRTDIYSLGCVLYEMLSGEIPLGGPTPQAMQQRRMSETPSPLHPIRGTVSPLVDQVIAKALATLPADRFDTAEQFGQALMVATMDATPVASLDLASTPGLTALVRAKAVRRIPRWLLVAVPALAAASLGVWQVAEWQAGATSNEAAQAAREPREIRLTHSGRVMNSALSPNGEYLAYAELRGEFHVDQQNSPPGGFNLMVAGIDPAEGLAEPRLIAPLQSLSDLRWNPDGASLGVSGRVREVDGVFLIPVFGGSQIDRLSVEPVPFFDWSPDGERFAVAVPTGSTVTILERRSAGPAVVVDSLSLEVEGDGIRGIAWSPAGDRMAVVTATSETASLWTVGLDGSNLKQLVTEDALNLGGGVAWASSGDALYYGRYSFGPQIMRLSLTREGNAAGPPELLLECGGYVGSSPDGSWAVCARSVSRSEMWFKPAESGPDSVLLVPEGQSGRGFSVSPDGQQVAFVKTGPGGLDLHVVSVATGESRQITQRGDLINRAMPWSPDGKYILYRSQGPVEGSNIWFASTEGGWSVRAQDILGGYLFAWAPGPDPLVSTSDRRNFRILEPPTRPWDAALSGQTVLRGIETRLLVVNDSVGANMAYPAVSPDGHYVAVNWNRGAEAPGRGGVRNGAGIWLISIDGQSQELLVPYPPGTDRPEPISWTREGDGIFVRMGTEIHLLRLATREMEFIAEPGGVCLGPLSTARGGFVCRHSSFEFDAWLIENFDPQAGP